MGIIAIKARSNPPMNLEFTETPFDQIALRIEFFVMPEPSLAISFGRDHDLHLP